MPLALCLCVALWLVTLRPAVHYGVFGLDLRWERQRMPAPPYRPSLIGQPPSLSFAGLFVGSTWFFETPPTGDFYIEYRYVVIPKRFLIPFALVLIAGSIRFFYLRRSRLQRQRELRGDCLVCGYNLTGNASGICPECGTPIRQICDMISD